MISPSTSSTITCVAAGPEHTAGLVALFKAAESSCFCRFWHFEGTNNDWLNVCANATDENESAFKTALATGQNEARGIVALARKSGEQEEHVIGWLKVTPAQTMRKAYERRFYKQLPALQGDREGVFLIGCALIHPEHRKHGVTKSLVAEAVRIAPQIWGAQALEALPRRPREAVRDEELWTGPMGAFTSNGFVEVGGPEPYPVLRRTFG